MLEEQGIPQALAQVLHNYQLQSRSPWLTENGVIPSNSTLLRSGENPGRYQSCTLVVQSVRPKA